MKIRLKMDNGEDWIVDANPVLANMSVYYASRDLLTDGKDVCDDPLFYVKVSSYSEYYKFEVEEVLDFMQNNMDKAQIHSIVVQKIFPQEEDEFEYPSIDDYEIYKEESE